MLALRVVFGGDTIDKNDEILNDVVVGVAKVIFIVGSVRENHGIFFVGTFSQNCNGV